MEYDRLTKVMVMECYDRLGGKDKKLMRKRKTMLYWKIMLSECGVDLTDVEKVYRDRVGRKKCVME